MKKINEKSVIRGEFSSRKVWIDGEELLPGPSQRLSNHSPDGFNWGYGGSGPAQFALALLLFFTDEAFALGHFQDFKWEIISHLPQSDFELPVSDVRAWIDSHSTAGPA